MLFTRLSAFKLKRVCEFWKQVYVSMMKEKLMTLELQQKLFM